MPARRKAEYERYTSAAEKQYYHELKGLPILMSDRRILYQDVRAIFNFEREIKGKGARKKTIPFFRFRLFWNTLTYKLKVYQLWENSLREIEIQRGTLTANVFYFIKYTFLFNVLLALIVFVCVGIPRIVFVFSENRDVIHLCTSGFLGNDSTIGKNLTEDELTECCFKRYHTATKVVIKNKNLRWLIELSEVLGGNSHWMDTPFFYGYYNTQGYKTNKNVRQDFTMWLSLLYIVSVVLVFMVSFCILVRNIANGIVEIVRNKDGEVCPFSELVFCGYYLRTRDASEARYRRKLWSHNLRVALSGAKTSTRVYEVTQARLIMRVIVFGSTTLAILVTAFAIYRFSEIAYDRANYLQHQDNQELDGILIRIGNGLLPSLAVSISNIILPTIFIAVSHLEKYTVETSTALILYRSLSVRLLSILVAVTRVFTKNYGCHAVIEGTCTECNNTGVDPPDFRSHCWESILAREFYKIILTEMVVKAFIVFVVDPFRKMLKKVFFRFKFMRNQGTLRFNVVRHSIDIINVQVMCWIGFYFAPAYPLIVCLYLAMMFYVKKFSALVNCVGTPETYRVARTTTIFLSGILVSFIFVLIYLSFVLGYLQPSRGCGPFSGVAVPWASLEEVLEVTDEKSMLYHIVDNAVSASVYIPLIFISLSILHHFWARQVRIQETAQNIKELIYMENQDKQYLAHKLKEQVKAWTSIHSYYDPVAIFDSEKRLVHSSKSDKRPDLARQWRKMKEATLPLGTTAGIKRGELSEQMKKHARALRAISLSNMVGKKSMVFKPLKKSTKNKKKKRKKPSKKKKKGRKKTKKKHKSDDEDDEDDDEDDEQKEERGTQQIKKTGQRSKNLKNLMRRILGKPYSLETSRNSSSSSSSSTELQDLGVGRRKKKQGNSKPKSLPFSNKNYAWDSNKRKKYKSKPAPEIPSTNRKQKLGQVGPASEGESETNGSTASPTNKNKDKEDAERSFTGTEAPTKRTDRSTIPPANERKDKDDVKTGFMGAEVPQKKRRRKREIRKLVKSIMSDPSLHPKGEAPAMGGTTTESSATEDSETNDKRFARETQKSNAVSGGSGKSTGMGSDLERAASYAGTATNQGQSQANNKPASTGTENEGKRYAWEKKGSKKK